MSYNKTIWNNGDVITDQKLNNIENGIYKISPRLINIPELQKIYGISKIVGQDVPLLGYKYQTGLTEEDFFGSILYEDNDGTRSTVNYYSCLKQIFPNNFFETTSEGSVNIDTPYIILLYPSSSDDYLFVIYLSELGGLFIQFYDEFNVDDLYDFIDALELSFNQLGS